MKRLTVRGIKATGTRDTTTFLRGDGTWNVPPGAGGSGAYHGVKVTLSASVSISTGAALLWTAEEHDTDGYHSLVTNTNRLTVPSGMAGYYKVWYDVELSNTAARKAIFPGGSFSAGGSTKGLYSDGPGGTEVHRASSAPIYMAVGDWVALSIFLASGSVTFGASHSAFGMYLVGT